MPKKEGESDLCSLDGGRMVICTSFLSLFLHHGLGDVQAVMDFQGGELFKEQGARSVSRFSLLDAEGQRAFYLKRHRRPPWGEQIREFLRSGKLLSSGRREWENIWKIRQLGILTVDPVGFGEKRPRGWEVESFLISQELDQASRLTEFIPRHFPLPLPLFLLSRKRQLVRDLALLARRIHEAGLFHRDFYLGHVFVKPREEGEIELYLVDLQRVIAVRWRSQRWRIKDLASLNFSAPKGWFTAGDRLRFYKQYRSISRLSQADKALIRRIAKKSQSIRNHTRNLLERGKIKKVPWGWERDVA